MIEILSKNKHNRKDFDCGNDLLNNYLQKQAGQDIKRKRSACFVLTQEAKIIQGYYTLSNNSIPLKYFSKEIQKRLPNSYKSIPSTLLGRLAINKRYQGMGLGKILLIDALRRSYDASKRIGSFAVVVDPIDHAAKGFYQKYDFTPLPDSGKIFIPMKTLKSLFG